MEFVDCVWCCQREAPERLLLTISISFGFYACLSFLTLGTKWSWWIQAMKWMSTVSVYISSIISLEKYLLTSPSYTLFSALPANKVVYVMRSNFFYRKGKVNGLEGYLICSLVLVEAKRKGWDQSKNSILVPRFCMSSRQISRRISKLGMKAWSSWSCRSKLYKLWFVIDF